MRYHAHHAAPTHLTPAGLGHEWRPGRCPTCESHVIDECPGCGAEVPVGYHRPDCDEYGPEIDWTGPGHYWMSPRGPSGSCGYDLAEVETEAELLDAVREVMREAGDPAADWSGWTVSADPDDQAERLGRLGTQGIMVQRDPATGCLAIPGAAEPEDWAQVIECIFDEAHPHYRVSLDDAPVQLRGWGPWRWRVTLRLDPRPGVTGYHPREVTYFVR